MLIFTFFSHPTPLPLNKQQQQTIHLDTDLPYTFFQYRALIKQKDVLFLRHFIAKHKSEDMQVRFQFSEEKKILQKINGET